MKTVKKFTAIILACLMLLGSFGAGASALEAPTTWVDKVELELDRDIAGKSPEDYKDFLKIKTEGVMFDPEAIEETGVPFDIFQGGGGVLKASGVAPASIGSVPMSEGPEVKEFRAGATYTMVLFLALDKENGYALSNSSPMTTVNGIRVDTYADDDYYFYAFLTFKVESTGISAFFENLFGRKTIDEVHLSIGPRIAGLTPAQYEEYITILTKGVVFDKDIDDVIEVYDLSAGGYIDDDDELVAGKTYGFEVYLKTKGNKVFAEDISSSANGYSADHYDVNTENYTQAFFAFIITVKDKITDPNVIADVSINIKRDVAGLTAEDYEDFITINTAGVEFDDKNDIPLSIFDYDAGRYLAPGEEMVAGTEYYFEIDLAAQSGKTFAPSKDFYTTISGAYLEFCDVNSDNHTQAFVVGYSVVTEPQQSFLQTILAFFAGIFESIGSIFEKKPV